MKFEKFIICVKKKEGISEEHLNVARKHFDEFCEKAMNVFRKMGGNLSFKDLQKAMPKNFWMEFISK